MSQICDTLKRLGIDTLKVRLTDFSIEGANLQVQPNPFNLQTGERFATYITDTHGTRIEGAKAYLNTEHINVDVSHKGAFVHFSVPNIVKGVNTYAVTDDETLKALDVVQGELKANGIRTDIFTGSDVSRVDVFNMATTEHLTTEYFDVWAVLKGRRQTPRGWPTTYLFQNKSRQTMFYDKDVQQAFDFGLKMGIQASHNLRAETRYLKARPVRDTLGTASLADFCTGLPEHLHTLYSGSINPIFKYASLDEARTVLTSNEFLVDLSHYKEQTGGRLGMPEIRQYIMSLGATYIVYNGGANALKEAVMQLTHYANPRELRRRLDEMLTAVTMRTAGVGRRLSSLYTELKNKLAA